MYQSSKYKNTTATSEKIKVTIEDTSIELKQTTLKKFDIYFGTATDIAAADVTVDEVVVGPSAEYRVNTLVKSVTMSADKKTATIEVFYDLKDGVSYEVTVKGFDKQTLVASAGAPVAMNIWAQDAFYKPISAGQVTVGQKTTLKYTLIDANGVDVTADTNEEKSKIVFNLKYTGKSGASYDTSYYANYAVFDFVEVGDMAVVTAEYATGEFENNTEVKVVAPTMTFYAVAKQHITVKAVNAFTTHFHDGYYDFWSSTKDIVKLGQNDRKLGLKLALVDGSELEIKSQEQTIVDSEGVTHGYVTVETVNNASKDCLDIETTGTMNLYPRKVGTAQLMVYYNAILSDGNIQKVAIAPVTIQVKEAPSLNAVNLNYSGAQATIVLSVAPADPSLSYGEASIQLKDQYGDDYTYENVQLKEIKGSNDAADSLVGTGIWFDDSAADSLKIKVDGTLFASKVLEMNNNNVKTSAIFTYTVKFQDTNTWAIKENRVVVDMRGYNSTVTPTIGVDLDGAQSGNIARIKADDPWDAKNEKTITFKVFEKMSGANFDKMTIAPYIGRDVNAVNAVTAGYYNDGDFIYKVFRNGVDVTESLAAKTDADGDKLLVQTDNEVKVRYSGTKYDANGVKVVDYTDVGAGSYQFVLYKVETNKYASDKYQTAKLTATVVNSATKNVSVTCDAGKYTLTGRDATSIYNTTGTVPTANGEFDGSYLDIMQCFNFADRNNGKFWKNDWDTAYDGSSNGEDEVIMEGNMVKYVVTLNDEKQKPSSVYVDKVTFYEEVATGLYASYEVAIGRYVDYLQEK